MRPARARVLLLGACVCAVALVCVAWAPGRNAPYQYDDWVTPVADPASQSLSAWTHALTTTLRPLTKLTFAVESSLGITDAPGRRATSFVLFALGAFVVGALLVHMGAPAWGAVCGATLWAVHPVHTETVLALAGRSALLALVLTLGSALFLLQSRHKAAFACAVLAVLARETAWPWLVVCAAFSMGPLGIGVAVVVGGALTLRVDRLRALVAGSWDDPFAFDRLGQQWAALSAGVVRLVGAPASFSVDIDFAPTGVARLAWILASFALVGGAVWLALRPGHPRALRVAALLWLSLALPTHSVIPKLDALTARDVSVGSAGLVLVVASLVSPWLWRMRNARVALPAIAVLVCVVLVAITRSRAERATDPVALWQDACARSADRARPCLNLGTVLAQHGRLHEARAALEDASRKAGGETEARLRLEAVDVLIETQKLLTDPTGRETLDGDGLRGR